MSTGIKKKKKHDIMVPNFYVKEKNNEYKIAHYLFIHLNKITTSHVQNSILSKLKNVTTTKIKIPLIVLNYYSLDLKSKNYRIHKTDLLNVSPFYCLK